MAGVLPATGTRGGLLGQFEQRRPRLAGFLGDNSSALMQFGMGLLSGGNRGEAWANASQGLAYGSQADQARRQRTQEEEGQARQQEARNNLLMSPEFQSLSAEDRAWMLANPDAADQFIASDIQRRTSPAQVDPVTVAQGTDLVHPITGELIYANDPAPPNGTDDMREYDLYRSQLPPGQTPLSFNDWDIARRRAGAPNYFENTWDRLTAEQQVSLSNDIIGAEQTALNQIQNFDAMEALAADPNFYSGSGNQLVANARRLGVALGISDPDAVASIEAFSGLAAQSALDAMGGSLGAGFSNADRDFIERTMPNLSFTPEGNRTLIAIHRAIAQRNIEIAEMLRAAGSRPTPEFMAGLTQWALANPLFADGIPGMGSTTAAVPAPAPAAGTTPTGAPAGQTIYTGPGGITIQRVP